jgi:hypothetical protein
MIPNMVGQRKEKILSMRKNIDWLLLSQMISNIVGQRKEKILSIKFYFELLSSKEPNSTNANGISYPISSLYTYILYTYILYDIPMYCEYEYVSYMK